MAVGLFVGLPADAITDAALLSSEPLPPVGEYRYGPANLADQSLRSAWCANVGAEGPAWITLRFDTPTPLAGLVWANGYAKSRQIFLANARVKALSVYADGRLLGHVGLDDHMGLQWSALPQATATEYRFVIETVYPGSKYADVCVTEILRDRRGAEAYALADALADAAGKRALNDAEIQSEYRKVYDFYRSFFDRKGLLISSDRPFWDALVLRASVRDQGSLRFLLNLRHQAGSQRSMPVELLEGLRDLVIPFLEDADASVVIDVWQDSNQAGRDALESAYILFVDPWSPEQLREYRNKNPGFDRITDLFCTETAASEGDKPHCCQGN